MHDTATLILAIIGSVIVWTSSVVAMVSWLNGKFRALEVLIYKEDNKNKTSVDRRIGRHAVRIQRLEAETFGVTHSGDLVGGLDDDAPS